MPKAKETTPAPVATSAAMASRTSKPKAQGIDKKPAATTVPVCKVTFTLPREAAPEADTVCVIGEFNEWSWDATPMKRRRNGDFFVSLDLEKGRAYRFRYLIDGCRFENDWHADRYEFNPYGSEDSVIEV